MTDEERKPYWTRTHDLRVLKSRGGYVLQQLWIGYPAGATGEPQRQWRVLPTVNGDDLTEEERGITFVKDLP